MEVALITGGASGIGFELAKMFAKDKWNIVLVGRSIESLNKAKLELEKYNIKVFIIAKDLSLKESPKEIYDEIQKLNLKVIRLVNNAGFGLMGSFTELDINMQLNMIDLNIRALVELTYYFIKEMKIMKKGKILNIASLASFTVGPYMSIYYASKNFVLSFSQGLKEELRFSGITVTALCPGATKTGFSKRAKANKSILFLVPMSVKRVARIGYVGMSLGVGLIVPGFINNIFALWLKLTPAIINAQFVRLTSIRFKNE